VLFVLFPVRAHFFARCMAEPSIHTVISLSAVLANLQISQASALRRDTEI
jgi:hypothetical protein